MATFSIVRDVLWQNKGVLTFTVTFSFALFASLIMLNLYQHFSFNKNSLKGTMLIKTKCIKNLLFPLSTVIKCINLILR